MHTNTELSPSLSPFASTDASQLGHPNSDMSRNSTAQHHRRKRDARTDAASARFYSFARLPRARLPSEPSAVILCRIAGVIFAFSAVSYRSRAFHNVIRQSNVMKLASLFAWPYDGDDENGGGRWQRKASAAIKHYSPHDAWKWICIWNNMQGD